MNIRTGNSFDTGIARTSSLLDRAREFRIEAVARTDRHSLVGIESFLRESRARGIHAVAGLEVDLVSGTTAADRAAFPLVLYAEDQTGFVNLARLVTAAHLNGTGKAVPAGHQPAGPSGAPAHAAGAPARPYVTFEDLERHHHGLIAQSPGLTGEVSIRVQRGELDLAEQLANRLAEVFGRSSLYLGLACYGRAAEARLAGETAALARRAGLATMAANEVDHLDADDAPARDLRRLIAAGAIDTTAAAGSAPLFAHAVAGAAVPFFASAVPGPASHFRPPAEVAALFRDHPEALENAGQVAARCRLPEDSRHFPRYPLPAGRTGAAYLASLCDRDGVADRRSRDRLDRELEAIAANGLAGYFLVLRDFTQYARAQQVTVGAGRGAVTSSAVAYRLGITAIDPLAHGLPFEHFLAAAASGPPEFGIEIGSSRRDEMIRYLEHRYGSTAVARAGRVDFYSPRRALQDTGRAIGMSETEVADVSARASDEAGADLALIVAHDSRLARQYRQDERVRTWFNLARRLQGLPRAYSPHPSAIVLAPDADPALPLQGAADGLSVAQIAWEDDAGPARETGDAGFAPGWMKIDLPGRKDLVAAQSGARQAALFDESLNLSPSLSSHAQAIARLAVEPGLAPRDLRSFLRSMEPETIGDLVTAFSLRALARRGRDLRELFLNRRRGEETFDLADPALEAVLGPTQGLLIDQEQLVEIAQVFAEFSVEEAEALRQLIVRDGADLAPWRHRFIAGAVRRGVSAARAGEVFLGLVNAGRVAPERAASAGEALMLYQKAYAADRKRRPRAGRTAMPWAGAGGADSEGWNYRHTGTDGPR